MKFLINLLTFSLLSSVALGFPITDGPPTLLKCLEKPPVPSVETLKAHLNVPAKDTCMFFTGQTMVAAEIYAESQTPEKEVLLNLDIDGWAAYEENSDDYAPECPLSFAYQEPYLVAGVGWVQIDLDQYWDNMSQAFTEICSGSITLSIPPSAEIPRDSVFARIEWPAIQRGNNIDSIYAVKLDTGDADGTPLSAPTLLWSRCG
ncbi:hypothetical protein BP5796_09706 [Coleophoma crateriformis]|uniref:Uncharacterized protein n=1 Tax=Coleophoma crateriformis TaxID=565419 RepID=A0A3D8QYV6_9HELO|nr:hypothetical protein BP5796_09706 [Coleophoma crateriformis]